MPTPAKGQPNCSRPRNKALAALSKSTPLVALEKLQLEAAKLRRADSGHADIDDDTVALVILHLQSRQSIKSICRQLKCSPAWAYTKIMRPEVQRFMAELAMSALGVAAARSLKSLEDLALSTKDERLRRDIAIELLDRAGLGNSTAQRATGHTQGYVFTFGPAPVKS